MKLIKKLLKKIADYFFRRKVKSVEGKLENAFYERIKKRSQLKKKIEEHVALKLKGRKRSKFIPASLKREILDTVYQTYGADMREVGLYLKPNLEYNV